MQERQGRMLTWLAGALVVLVGVVVLGDAEDAGQDEDEELFSPALPDLLEDQIDAVSITGPDGSVSVERSEEGWLLTEPLPAPSDLSPLIFADALLEAVLFAAAVLLADTAAPTPALQVTL